METSIVNNFTRADLSLFVTTLFYFLMNGAQIFETIVIIPKWTAAPPDSLHYLKGKYRLDLKTFWIAMHTLHEITFIISIIFCWNSEIRNPLLILLSFHLMVRIWTILYFAPRILKFEKIANLEEYPKNLSYEMKAWRNLNYLRVSAFLVISIAFIPLCIKMFFD